jgi:hypothetical protein
MWDMWPVVPCRLSKHPHSILWSTRRLKSLTLVGIASSVITPTIAIQCTTIRVLQSLHPYQTATSWIYHHRVQTEQT